jgi:hypothetical protein
MKNLFVILIVLVVTQTGFGQEKDLPQYLKLDTISCIGDSMLFISKTYIEKSLVDESAILYVVEHKKRNSFIKEAYYHGESREWYRNGQLKAIGEYNLGQKVGKWEYWNEEGLPISENEAMGVKTACGESIITFGREIKIPKKGRKIKTIRK